MLVAKYEIFFMKKDKSIVSMIIRFTNIINDLKDLDCKFTNDELVNKILLSLLESWSTLKTMIETTKTTAKYTLMTHELNIAKTKTKTQKK